MQAQTKSPECALASLPQLSTGARQKGDGKPSAQPKLTDGSNGCSKLVIGPMVAQGSPRKLGSEVAVVSYRIQNRMGAVQLQATMLRTALGQ